MDQRPSRFTVVDLFCGIGGMRLAAESLGVRCLFSCDIDPEARKAYEANFGETPAGDIAEVNVADVPAHDVLLAGFPCQPFSICGTGKGFDDTRGTLFFEVARILEAKRPPLFLLENVKRLATHQQGRTMGRIVEVLTGLGYWVDSRVLNALDFGLPQKRERVLIVGGLQGAASFQWPSGGIPMKPLSQVLEPNAPAEYYASPYIIEKRLARHRSAHRPGIWHENKAGNVCSYPYSCALRANASYNYLLVDGVRRLTPREMLRLQGFPDSFRIVCSPAEVRKQAGNAVPVPMVEAVLARLLAALSCSPDNDNQEDACAQPKTQRGGQGSPPLPLECVPA